MEINDIRVDNAQQRVLQAEVDRLLSGKNSLKILEAGCGTECHLKFQAQDIHITGIDTSRAQLEKNKDVHEKIEDSVETCQLSNCAYDVIVCWYVLEHISQPIKTMLNLMRACKPGGIIVIIAPNVWSLKGLIAKLTPFWFHKMLFRMLYRIRNTQEKGIGPFRSYMRACASFSAMRRLAEQNSFSIEYAKAFEAPIQQRFRERYMLANICFIFFDWLGRILSFNRFNSELSDYSMIIRKE